MVTRPNVWFVGVTPRRNPELVVAVLWQNGEFSYYPARIGAEVVAAYVDKQRRLAHNLPPAKAAGKPVEVGAVWTDAGDWTERANGGQTARLHAGHFFVHPSDAPAQPAVAENDRQALPRTLTKAAPWQGWDGPSRAVAAGRGASRASLEEAMSPVRRFLSFRDFDWALLGMVLVLCTISVLRSTRPRCTPGLRAFPPSRSSGSPAAWS